MASMLGRGLRRAWAHPRSRSLGPDDARAPTVHGEIIREKRLLRGVYDEWYAALVAEIGARRPIVEIGSGAGYLAECLPGLVTSDVRLTPAVRLVFDAHSIPVRDAVLGGIVMTNALHHLSDPGRFLNEAARVVRPGGRLAAIEPWVSAWSRFVYGQLHHEPFQPDARDWSFDSTGPMSGANGALPWMLFARDRQRFAHEHPEWSITCVRPGWPLRYPLSGGVSLRSLVPAWTDGLLKKLEQRLTRADRWSMFALIVLERRATQPFR